METALIGATTFPAAQDLADLQRILQPLRRVSAKRAHSGFVASLASPLRHHLSDRLVMLKISCLHGES
jgi:hypothetical protein